MSIYVTSDTKAIIQGATGKTGSVLVDQLEHFGTSIVAGVAPGHGGETVSGLPVYNTVAASKQHSPNTSLVTVPPQYTKAACLEAIEAGIETLIVVTEEVPIHDTLEIIEKAKRYDITVIGPNTVGVISPGETAVMLAYKEIKKWYQSGTVGIVARSGSVSTELANQLTKENIGQSTVLSVGGDPYLPTTPADVLMAFENDEETNAAVYVGEIGGGFEKDVAKIIKDIDIPVFASVVGQNAPDGKPMGHAGAVAGNTSAKEKIAILDNAGAIVTQSPFELSSEVSQRL